MKHLLKIIASNALIMLVCFLFTMLIMFLLELVGLPTYGVFVVVLILFVWYEMWKDSRLEKESKDES